MHHVFKETLLLLKLEHCENNKDLSDTREPMTTVHTKNSIYIYSCKGT